MADDDDPGSTHLKNFMSESQPSREAGGFGDKRRNRALKGTDSYYENRYGGGDKSLAMDPDATSGIPERGRKGDKL